MLKDRRWLTIRQLAGGVAIGLCLGVISLAIPGCAGQAKTGSVQRFPIKLLPPVQPAEAELRPGLAAYYLDRFFTHIDNMPAIDRIRDAGRPGPPIARLNHRFGKGNVFDSGRQQGVGMFMEGWIRFPDTGPYEIKARSNDGVRVFIGDAVVVDDPAVHGDRFSEAMTVAIESPGWYFLKILYFQKKGSATLELYWKRPSTAAFDIIPAEAFAHAGS